MKDLINSAAYMIQLASNSVEKATRDTYCSDIENFDDYLSAIEVLFKSILRGFDVENYTSETALELFDIEYDESNLAEYLGNKTGYIELLKFLMESKYKKPSEAKVEDFKNLINIADTLHEKIAINIYQICLMRLVYGNMILDDLDFAKKVITYIDNSPNKNQDNKKLYDVVFDAVNHI